MSRHSKEAGGLSEVKNDVAAIREDFSRLLHDLKETGVQGLTDGATTASDTITEYAERSKESLVEARAKIGEYISERPITSLAIAAGVGAILFRVLKR